MSMYARYLFTLINLIVYILIVLGMVTAYGLSVNDDTPRHWRIATAVIAMCIAAVLITYVSDGLYGYYLNLR